MFDIRASVAGLQLITSKSASARGRVGGLSPLAPRPNQEQTSKFRLKIQTDTDILMILFYF
jgi:hypothetical protein